MNKVEIFLKRHSSTILTVVGAGGVVATSVLAVKATPKALTLLEEAKNEKGDKLTTTEVIAVAWKPYIPAIVTGVSTIACIFGANYLSIKNQASLMSAYALLDSSYKEYRNKVNELYGEDADEKVKQEMVTSRIEQGFKATEGKQLFFDHQSMQFFESTMEDVLNAEQAFMEILNERGYACINEYYDLLGIPHAEFGWQLCWWAVEENDPWNCHELEFMYYTATKNDGSTCCIIDTNMPPTIDRIL